LAPPSTRYLEIQPTLTERISPLTALAILPVFDPEAQTRRELMAEGRTFSMMTEIGKQH
jgi:hypothetical protein